MRAMSPADRHCIHLYDSTLMRTVPILMLVTTAAFAQAPLSLKDAVATALAKHPSIEAASARVKAAEARIDQARGGRLPKLNYQESWQRSNNPVFVFSSLLTQHQFTEDNFALGPLNRPEAINNFQSIVSVDQTIYDGRQISTQIRSAELGKTMTREEERGAQMNVIAGVVRTYYGAVLAQASLEVAREAVKSAEADLQRAESVLAAGMATQADVLAIRVHLAAMREQQIRRRYDLEVARAALNEALGLPLDEPHDLATPLTELAKLDAAAADFEKHAEAERPDLREANLMTQLAQTQVSGAKGSLLPQVGFRGMFEADRQQFVNKGGANWLVGATLKWNLFDGNTNRARIREASESLASARKQQEQLDRGIKLQVRKAWADYQSSRERVDVAAAAVSQAEESLRIIKDRYDNGLTTTTVLLRSETALLEARTRRLAALYDVRVAAAALHQTAGILTGDSDVLK